jgi:catechol 2,3-dioxygenase-like lactoylglutathione lyase family enzyme
MAALTHGIDHLGLSVRDLDATTRFFTECLDWKEVGGKPDYPSKFVSDGTSVLTLWQVQNEDAAPFDRKKHVGLHHVAFKIATEQELNSLFNSVSQFPGIEIECPPEFSGSGPKVHFFVNEPGGLRLEFAYDPR